MKILIKNGRIVDSSQNIDKQGDVLINNGKVEKIAPNIDENDAKIINAKGKIVTPGFIDMHTHLREPGYEDKETVKTGLRAAIRGGFTTVCPMPNTKPACDNQAQVTFLLEKAREAKGNVIPVAAITKNREGKELTEMMELKEAGACAVSDDGDSVQDTVLMRHALEYAAMAGLLVISHCEDKRLAAGGVMHEGYWSTVLGLAPIPSSSESIMVERDIKLAEMTGARIHIAHVSAKESVAIIREAKKRGVQVTCEVTPHHFTLEDRELASYDTNLKVNPPLRAKEDIEALKKAIKDGTVDCIATDHAPHLESEKEKEFDYAPFGMIGLETALSLAVMGLIDTGVIDWVRLVGMMSTVPAKILKYDRGTLVPGAAADVTIIDPAKEWIYSKETIASRSSNSPFVGKKLKGKVTDVIVGGKIVMENEAIL